MERLVLFISAIASPGTEYSKSIQRNLGIVDNRNFRGRGHVGQRAFVRGPGASGDENDKPPETSPIILTNCYCPRPPREMRRYKSA